MCPLFLFKGRIVRLASDSRDIGGADIEQAGRPRPAWHELRPGDFRRAVPSGGPGHGAAGADRPARGRRHRRRERQRRRLRACQPRFERDFRRRGCRADAPTPWRSRRPDWIGRCGALEDYRRFAGRRAKIVMREQGGRSGSSSRAVLAGLEGGDVLIDGDDGRPHRVPIGVITRANLEVEFYGR